MDCILWEWRRDCKPLSRGHCWIGMWWQISGQYTKLIWYQFCIAGSIFSGTPRNMHDAHLNCVCECNCLVNGRSRDVTQRLCIFGTGTDHSDTDRYHTNDATAMLKVNCHIASGERVNLNDWSGRNAGQTNEIDIIGNLSDRSNFGGLRDLPNVIENMCPDVFCFLRRKGAAKYMLLPSTR